MFTRKIYVLLAIVVLCLGVYKGVHAAQQVITYTTSSDEARNYFMQGLENSEYFQFPQAIENFQNAIKADSKFAIAYYYLSTLAPTNAEQQDLLNKAVEYSANASKPEQLIIQSAKDMNEDKMDKAKADLEQMVKVVPQDKRAHNAMGMYYFMQRDWKPAESEFQKAVAIDQAYAPAYNNLAYIYSYQGKYPDAIKALQKYAEIRPKDANPHDSMGEIYLWMGDYANSLKEYQNSLALDPKFTPSLAGIGHVNVFQEKFDDARDSYDKMLANASNVGDTNMAQEWKAVSYLHENKPDQAIMVLNDAANFAHSHNNIVRETAIQGEIADIYLMTDNLDKALLTATKEEKMSQGDNIDAATKGNLTRDANAMEAIVAARQGHMDMSKSWAEGVRKSAESSNNPIAMQSYYTLEGIIAYWTKDYSTAMRELRKASPDDQIAKYFTALTLEATGKKEQAHPLYEQIAKYNHNSLEYALVRPLAIQKMQMQAGY